MQAKEMAADVLSAVKGFVERSLRPLSDRVSELEKRAPIQGPMGEKGLQGDRGIDGAPGKDGAPGRDGEKGADGERGPIGLPGPKGDTGERGPEGIKGAEGIAGRDGRDGKDGERGPMGERGPAGDQGPRGEKGADGIQGPMGERGLKGEAGIDGKDGAPGPRGEKGLDGKDGAAGLNGKDGAPGRDGKDFDIEEVRGVLESELSKWELEFERRAAVTLQKAIDRMPAPKDGENGINGKDGSDGLGIDDFDVDYDGERTFTMKWANGERVVAKSFKVPVTLYREVYKTSTTYERGDSVTYGGALWIATKDAPTTPGTADSGWRLSVKNKGEK